MTLLEMSNGYQSSASAIHARIQELRAFARASQDPDEAFHIQRRIRELLPLWQEAKDLANLTAHYYDRSYHKHEQYTL